MTRSVKKLALWLSIGLVILAGVSLVWPVNNTFLSGDCIGARLDDGSCPLRWDRVDTGSIREAVVTTSFLVDHNFAAAVAPMAMARLRNCVGASDLSECVGRSSIWSRVRSSSAGAIALSFHSIRKTTTILGLTYAGGSSC